MTDRLGRRGFLALTGATALAGCNGFLSGDSEPKPVDGARLREMAARDAPTVAPTLPITIEEWVIDEYVDRAESLLADTPGTFDSEAVPNGVIRERLNRNAVDARDGITGVTDGESDLHRLSLAGYARGDAREVRGTWRAIDDGWTVEDVRADASGLEDALEQFIEDWVDTDYVGDDPVGALRVHAEVERQFRRARSDLRVGRYHSYERGNPLEVGEAAADMEGAQVALYTGSYLFDRFTDSLDGGTALRDRFEDVRLWLVQRRREQVDSLVEPGEGSAHEWLVERDVGRTAGTNALQDLYGEVHDVGQHADDSSIPALAREGVGFTSGLVYHRAFEALRERMEGGDDVAVESAADVVDYREAAVSAVESARESETAPELVAEFLPEFSIKVEWADRRFEDPPGGHDEFDARDAGRYAGEYVYIAAVCAVLPEVCGEVADALHNGTA